ncbi:hypothetical protein Dimus_025817 [Dionaea muscipula]
MAAAQLGTAATFNFPRHEGVGSSSTVKFASFLPLKQQGIGPRSIRPLFVRAATVVAPTYTSIKPLADRVLVKIKQAEEKTAGGILLPSTAQTKSQGGEVVAVGEGRTIGNNTIQISVKPGTQVVYSKYAGTELEFNGSNHLLLKEDDIVGILETDDVKDLKPLTDRVLIKVPELSLFFFLSASNRTIMLRNLMCFTMSISCQVCFTHSNSHHACSPGLLFRKLNPAYMKLCSVFSPFFLFIFLTFWGVLRVWVLCFLTFTSPQVVSTNHMPCNAP